MCIFQCAGRSAIILSQLYDFITIHLYDCTAIEWTYSFNQSQRRKLYVFTQLVNKCSLVLNKYGLASLAGVSTCCDMSTTTHKAYYMDTEPSGYRNMCPLQAARRAVVKTSDQGVLC